MLLAAVRAEPMVDGRFGTSITRVSQDGTRVSALDCFGRSFVALAAAAADLELLQAWAPGVEVLVEGRDFQDPDGEWRRLYGFSETGVNLQQIDRGTGRVLDFVNILNNGFSHVHA